MYFNPTVNKLLMTVNSDLTSTTNILPKTVICIDSDTGAILDIVHGERECYSVLITEKMRNDLLINEIIIKIINTYKLTDDELKFLKEIFSLYQEISNSNIDSVMSFDSGSFSKYTLGFLTMLSKEEINVNGLTINCSSDLFSSTLEFLTESNIDADKLNGKFNEIKLLRNRFNIPITLNGNECYLKSYTQLERDLLGDLLSKRSREYNTVPCHITRKNLMYVTNTESYRLRRTLTDLREVLTNMLNSKDYGFHTSVYISPPSGGCRYLISLESIRDILVRTNFIQDSKSISTAAKVRDILPGFINKLDIHIGVLDTYKEEVTKLLNTKLPLTINEYNSEIKRINNELDEYNRAIREDLIDLNYKDLNKIDFLQVNTTSPSFMKNIYSHNTISEEIFKQER